MRPFRRPPAPPPPGPARPPPAAGAPLCGLPAAGSPCGPGEQQLLVRLTDFAVPFASAGLRAALSRPRERREAGGERMWNHCPPCVTAKGQRDQASCPGLPRTGQGSEAERLGQRSVLHGGLCSLPVMPVDGVTALSLVLGAREHLAALFEAQRNHWAFSPVFNISRGRIESVI